MTKPDSLRHEEHRPRCVFASVTTEGGTVSGHSRKPIAATTIDGRPSGLAHVTDAQFARFVEEELKPNPRGRVLN